MADSRFCLFCDEVVLWLWLLCGFCAYFFTRDGDRGESEINEQKLGGFHMFCTTLNTLVQPGNAKAGFNSDADPKAPVHLRLRATRVSSAQLPGSPPPKAGHLDIDTGPRGNRTPV